MKYYPLFLDIKGREILLIGGGNIAYEKILNLLKAGAKLTVIAPEILPKVRRFSKRITFINRVYMDGDIDEKYLIIFGATGDSELNAKISKECLDRRILCNTVDDPQYCHFIVPAIVRRGQLTMAISSAGVSPTLAKLVKSTLYMVIGVEFTQFTRFLNHFRFEVRNHIPTLSGRMAFWTLFYKKSPLEILKYKGLATLQRQARELLENFDG